MTKAEHAAALQSEPAGRRTWKCQVCGNPHVLGWGLPDECAAKYEFYPAKITVGALARLREELESTKKALKLSENRVALLERKLAKRLERRTLRDLRRAEEKALGSDQREEN